MESFQPSVALVASLVVGIDAYLAFVLAFGKLAFPALLRSVEQSSVDAPEYSAAFVGSSSPSSLVVVCPFS